LLDRKVIWFVKIPLLIGAQRFFARTDGGREREPETRGK